MMEDRLYTVSEVAKILRVSESWVYAHATRQKPRLPAIKIGGGLRFRESKLRAFVEALEAEARERAA